MNRHSQRKLSRLSHPAAHGPASTSFLRRARPLLLTVAIASALLATTTAAQAATTRWKTGAGTQNWFNANNWTGGVPDTTMDVIIDNTDPGGNGALLGNNSATVRSLAVGAPDTGLLTVNGGAQLTVRKGFTLGNTTDSAGTLNVSGAGTSIAIGNVFQVGPRGDGVLNITNGATVTDDTASLADFNGYVFKKSTGTYIKVSNPATANVVVSGANSLWGNADGLTVGNGGSAVVTLADGGTLSAGDGNGGKGTVQAGWAAVSQARGQINIGAANGDAAAAPGVLDAATLAFGNYGRDATGAQKGGGGLLFNHTSNNYVFSAQVTGHAYINFISGTTALTAAGSSVVNALVDQGATMILDGGSLDLDVTGEVQGGNSVALTVGDTGAGTLTLTNGAALLLGGAHSLQVARAATASGTLNIGAAQGKPAAAPGRLTFTSDAAQPWIQFRDGAGTIVFNHTSNAYTFDAALQGNGSLIQDAGTTILTADNSQHRGGGASATGFTGPVTINGGTLLVNNTTGSGTGTGDVTVNANGTLGGTGEIAGNVNGVGTGSLQGVQGQTLTIDGNLNLNNDSNIGVTLNTPDKSVGMFDVKGNLVLDGNINVTDGGGMGPGVYRMFDYGGTLTDNTAVIGTVPSGVSKTAFQVQTSVANQVNLISSAGQQLFYWDGDAAGNGNNGTVDGGSGAWTATGTTWTNTNGTTNVVMSEPGFAIFETTGGTVNVAAANATVTGMQFAAGGYTLAGNAIVLTTDQAGGNIVRVGDGTVAGAGMTTIIDSVLAGGTGLRKTDRGTLILTNYNLYNGGTTIEGGVLQVASSANLGAGVNAVTLDGGTLRVATGAGFSSDRPFIFTDAAASGGINTNGGNAVIDGKISGPGVLVKLGTGSLLLDGANSYGGTIVKAGTLFGNAGSIAGDVGVSSGATAQFNQSTNATFAGHFTGKGIAVKNGTGNLTLSGQSDGTLNWNILDGNLIARSDLFHSNADIGGGQLVFKQDASSNYGGKLTDSGRFIKQGAGVVQLTGDNSAFAGSTLVSGGGITVSDTLGGSVSVSNGASLGGSGEILGKVGIADGGILLGDQEAGPLTMHGLVLNNGSLVDVSLSGPGNTTGLFDVQGDLTLDGTLNITDEGDSFGAGVYRVMDYSGTLTDDGMDVGTVPDGFSSAGMAVQTSVANQVNLVTASGDLQFWDGDAAGNAGNSKVDGGDGTWTATSTNWTDKDGAVNNTMNPTPGFAIFEATPGTVTVDNSKGDITVTGMQFASNGYVVWNAPITLDNGGAAATLRVGDGTAAGAKYTATIADQLTAKGGIMKTDLGTLVLTNQDGDQIAGDVAVDGGTLLLSAGAKLNSIATEVGYSPTQNGVLLVTGSGASWETDGLLDVGYGGVGTMTVTNGAQVSSGTGRIGGFDNGMGLVDISGVGSQWTVTGDLTVGGGDGPSDAGGAGHGTLTLTDGGTISVGGLMTLGATGNTGAGASVGTLNIGAATGATAAAPGTLDVKTLTFGPGTGTLVFNHTDAGYAFAPVLSGTGAMRQIAGTTNLTGNSGAFNGTVTVEGGTLGVDNNIGNSAVTVQKGGTLTGTGLIEGPTTVQGGGILAGRSGDQLTLASLTLQSGAIVDASLGAPASTNADALFNLSSGLTLDGTLNVSDAGGFGKGTYRLINYDGKLTDNGMSIGTVPSGFSAADMTVQTSVADQVNLVEAPASTGPGGGGDTVQFWDGDTAGNASNGKIDGGDGTWTATSSNWTDVDGTTNGPMSPTPGFAIFESAPGTVTVDDGAGPVAVTDMQFASDGYTVKGGAINLDATNSMLRVGDGTAAGADYTAAVDADINGTGQVTKTDLGTLVLGGTDTWNGTTVQDGTLAVEGQLASDVQVQSGATLSGHGTVKGDVTNTGTVAPGGSVGTLTVDGDYTNSADGVLEADIAPDGSGDLLKVTGKATLQGGTVDVVKATGNYSGDTRYTLVDAAGGVIGTFDTLTQNTPFLNLALGYDADHVYLSVLRNHVSFCDVAGTVNECDTGQGVESTGVANPLYDTIAGLPDTATARAAFDQLSGEFHASQQAARVEDSRFVREAMNRRLREGAADAEADRVPGTRLTAWAHGWGHWGSIDGDGNAAKLSDNGDGLLIGADLPVGKTGRIGVTGGAARNSLSVDARNAWARTTAQWLGVYGGFTQGPFAFRAGAAYAWEQIPAYREVNFPGLSERLSSNAIGDTVTGYVEGAWRIQTAVGEIAPYLNIANVQVHTGRATEVGGTAALHMTSQGMDTSLSTLGVRGHWQLAQRLSLHADLGWQHAFGDTLPERTQWFARGDAFTVYGVPLANNAGLGRLGLSWQAAPNITVAADYEGLWGGGVQDQAAKASLQVKF